MGYKNEKGNSKGMVGMNYDVCLFIVVDIVALETLPAF